MTSTLNSRMAIVARSDLSPGSIAGAVVGSVVGLTIILIPLGFLYFRHRRRARQSEAESQPHKAPTADRRLSFPGPDQASAQPPTSQVRTDTFWSRDGQTTQTGPSSGSQQHAASNNGTVSTGLANQFTLPQESNFGDNFDLPSYPRPSSKDAQETIGPYEYDGTSAVLNGGAASYYDTNIAMESDTEQPPMPPSRQMTEMYQEQLQRARESRKNSRSSTWSRLTGRFKRKRSTRVSEIAQEEGFASVSPTSPHQDVPIPSIERLGGRTADPGRGFEDGAQLYEEPQEISDGSRVDQHDNKKPKRRGPSGDATGEVPHRLDSLDPQLPSFMLRQPLGPSDQLKARQATRFQSPALPEPMDIDASDIPGDERASVVRSTGSPDALDTAGINPMDIMRPSNAAEKAAYNDAELIRIASASVSPPTSPPNTFSPPPTDPAGAQLDIEDENVSSDSDEEESDNEEPYIHNTQQQFGLGLPIIGEPTSDEGPSDWSTPAGQSSTNPSSGRTPGTELTPSPSPGLINGMLQPQSSLSPADSAASDKPVLTCEECGRGFDQIHKLNHHKRYHDRKHVCPYPDCSMRFGTKTHLDRHINDKHEKKKGFHCTQADCVYSRGGKSFPRKDNWRRHMQNKHNITPTFEPEPAE